MALKVRAASSLIGGGAGALDAIDGTNLQDGEPAIAFVVDTFYFYNLDADSAAAESSPNIISPDANAGDKRWILVGSFGLSGVLTLSNTGLHLLDTNASHDLIIKPGSDLTADRIVTITTGDAPRTFILGADVTLNADLTGGILDEDDMASDSATALATQQSIKAYVDAAALKSVPSTETILFYKDTVVTGYTLENTLDNKVVYVTKGSAAGGETGGGAHSTGTWTQPNHTHIATAHVHGIGSLKASISMISDTIVRDLISGEFTYDRYVDLSGLTQATGSGTAPDSTAITGETASGGTVATAGSATANTWRPAAYCMTLQTRN